MAGACLPPGARNSHLQRVDSVLVLNQSAGGDPRGMYISLPGPTGIRSRARTHKKGLTSLTADIVAAYVAHNAIIGDKLSDLIGSVYAALSKASLQTIEPPS